MNNQYAVAASRQSEHSRAIERCETAEIEHAGLNSGWHEPLCDA
jgi:hypothetical protein